jgi:hypothetical protein
VFIALFVLVEGATCDDYCKFCGFFVGILKC